MGVEDRATLIAQESVCRMCERVRRDIKEGRISIDVYGPGQLRGILGEVSPVAIALARISQLAGWN